MRSVMILLAGLLTGALLTLIAVNSLSKGTAYPNGVMAVMAAQMGQLDGKLKAGACSADDLAQPLLTLMALGNDLEPAFLPTADDNAFSSQSADYRAAVDSASTALPTDCTQASEQIEAISLTCKACHQQFKD